MTANPYDAVRASDAMMAALRARHPMLIDLTTSRVERLLDKLGRPQDRLACVIHIAGTNGKGSTAAFLRAIGEAAGLRVCKGTSIQVAVNMTTHEMCLRSPDVIFQRLGLM